jgi:hypothetical protein
LLGISGLAIPVFTTSQTKDVVKLGDLKIQNTEQSTRVIPQALSGGAFVSGVEGLWMLDDRLRQYD